MLFPPGAPQTLVTVYDPFGNLIIRNASGDLAGGTLTYEDGPSGCLSAQLALGLTYEQVEAEGYWTARNIVEISCGDDAVQLGLSSGATKIYVGSKLAYDLAQGHDQGQIAISDGSTLTARIPVTGVGTDGSGDFITVGTPLAGGGNPVTIPAYSSGAVIYRRRYAGIIRLRTRPNNKAPGVTVQCTGLSQRLNETNVTFALTTSTVDMGTAIYILLAQFATRWPELTIAAANFSTTGQTSFDSSYQDTQISRVIGDLLSAANSGGDQWTLRIGHDRIPRLVQLYQFSGNTYAYNVTLPQGVTYFEPRTFVNTDEDASRLYNSVEVIGDTDPSTQLPVSAIVQDADSIGLYGQIDAQPQTNTACKTADQCAIYGQSLLSQQSFPRANAEFIVSTRNDDENVGPMGLSRGDVVLGVHNVTVTDFEGSASDVFGLVASAITTIEPAGDTYQDVRFSAIEPDIMEAMKERANALSSSLLQNVKTQTGLTSYCVSSGAFIDPPPASGLVVTVALFLAMFAQGTAPILVGGNTFTVNASSTNRVWLNPDGSWTVNTDATIIPGSILYGIYQTSGPTGELTTESGTVITTEGGTPLTTESGGAGSVIGFIPKAPIGVIQLTQIQLPSMGDEATAAPILTPTTPTITYPVKGNGAYDASATFAVDLDAATAPWLVGLALFAVTAGDSTDDPRDFPYGDVPVAQWTGFNVTAVWTNIGAGSSKDLYVAYEDGQGRYSEVVKVGTTDPNKAGTTGLLGVSTSAPSPASSPSSFTYATNGGGTYDAEATIHLDTNGTTANNGLAEIECVMAPHASGLVSSSNGWTPSGNPQLVNGTGAYVCAWGGCGIQIAYDVGVRYVGQDGSRSQVYIVGTTTAAQLAQLEFPTAAVDPTTGYIVIKDQSVYESSLTYSLQTGVGSLLSARMALEVGSTSIAPCVGVCESSGSAYWAEWGTDGFVRIIKGALGGTIEAVSASVGSTDPSHFRTLEIAVSESTSGTVNVMAMLDGQIQCQFSDSSSPLTSGHVAVAFVGANGTNLIDPKTISVNIGGTPSTTGIKGQGNLLPSNVLGIQIQFNISLGTVGVTGVGGSANTLFWPDGSSSPSNFAPGTFSGGISVATYFLYVSVNPSLPAGITGYAGGSGGGYRPTVSTMAYIATSQLTVQQSADFTADGWIPIVFNVPFANTGSSTFTTVSGGGEFRHTQ